MTVTNEQRARELLAAEYRKAHDADPKCNFTADTYEVAVSAIAAALAEPKAGAVPIVVIGDWQELAAEWLEQQAVEQEKANDEYPTHAAAYKEWRDRPLVLRMLAEKVAKAPDPQFTVKRACPPPSWMFPDEPAAPQAKPGDAYRKAVDQGRVVAHLGTAEATDDDETAVRKLGELIDWHIAVATDPAVNGGFKLVPVAGEAEQQGQAVAYVRWHPIHGYRWSQAYSYPYAENLGWVSVPVYTRPQPAAVDAVRAAGTALSNIAYNLAQDNKLSPEVRESLDWHRKQWDAALSAHGREGEVGHVCPPHAAP